MRNLLDQAPTLDLHGASLQAARLVRDVDLHDRDLLDVGCGFGSFLLDAHDRGARVTGLEISEQAIATARRHVPQARLVVGSALELPFGDASFDTVTAFEVIEHVPRGGERLMLGELARVLRPGGVVCLSTPHAAWPARLSDPAWPFGHRHYTTQQVRGFADGLDVCELFVGGGAWRAVFMLDLYLAKWVFRRAPFYQQALERRVDAELTRPGWMNVYLRATSPER